MKLNRAVSLVIVILISVPLIKCNEDLPIIQRSISPGANLYVGMFQDNHCQEFINIVNKLLDYFRSYSIHIGFVDCEFLSYYSNEIQQKYCTSSPKLNENVLVFNDAHFLYELGKHEINQPLEIFSSNILEQQIQQKFDLAYLTTVEDSTQFLKDLLKQEKDSQNVVLINFSQTDSNSHFSGFERKEILESVYECAEFNRFVFVYDKQVYLKIIEEIKLDATENIHIFLCKLKNCERMTLSGSTNKQRLVNLMNIVNHKNTLEYDGTLDELVNDQKRENSAFFIYFKRSAENRNLNKFKELALAFQQNVLGLVNFVVISDRRIAEKCINECIGIYVKQNDIFMLANYSSVNLETAYNHLTALTSLQKDLERNIDKKYEFLDSGLTQLNIKFDLNRYFDVLTDKSYYSGLKSRKALIVYYYLPWEKDSLLGANQLIELSKIWNQDACLYNPFGVINCFDYSDFCSNYLNVNEFPSVRFFSNGELIKRFYHVPETKVILDFLSTYLSNNPIELSDVNSVTGFLKHGLQFDTYHIQEILNELLTKFHKTEFVLRVILNFKPSQQKFSFDQLKSKYPGIVLGIINCERTPEICTCHNASCFQIQTTEIYFDRKFTQNYVVDAKDSIEEYIKPRIKMYEEIFSEKRNEKFKILLMISDDDKRSSEVLECFYELSSMNSMRLKFDFFILDLTKVSAASSSLLLEYSGAVFSPAVVFINLENNNFTRFNGDLEDSKELTEFLLQQSDEFNEKNIKPINNHDEF